MAERMDSPRATAARGRPRKVDEAQRYNLILSHAVDEFTVHGFSGTSIDSIARRAQVSKMTIYKHFGNKEGLLRAMGLRASGPVQERIAQVQTAGRPVPQVLSDFARALRYREKDSLAFGLLRLAIFEQHRFPTIAEAIYRSGVDTLGPLIGYMAELIDAGLIASGDPEEIAMHFCALATRGHRFLLVDDADEAAQEQFIQRTIQLFLHGALQPGEQPATSGGLTPNK